MKTANPTPDILPAGILLGMLKKHEPEHVYIGDASHAHRKLLLEELSREDLIHYLAGMNFKAICTEMSCSAAEKISRLSLSGTIQPEESDSLKTEKLREFVEYAKKVRPISLMGIDVHAEDESYKSHLLALEKYESLCDLILGVLDENRSLNNGLDTQRTVLWKFLDEHLKDHPDHEGGIFDIKFHIAELMIKNNHRNDPFWLSPVDLRMTYDQMALDRLLKSNRNGPTFAIFGDGHYAIPNGLPESKLVVTYCATKSICQRALARHTLDGFTPNYYLDAESGVAIEGHEFQRQNPQYVRYRDYIRANFKI